MANFVTKEVGLDNMTIPHGIVVLYSIWTIKLKETDEVIFHDDHDVDNITSRIFTNIFEVGKTYVVTLSMVRNDGPTIATEPFEITITSTGDVTDKYHLPSVVDTPVITAKYDLSKVPNNNAVFTASAFTCFGNATHKNSDWWLCNDNNKLVWESLEDETNLRTIRLDKLNLDKNKAYTLFVVYRGTNRDTSAAGSITFTVDELEKLTLQHNMNDISYGYPINTGLADVPAALTEFTWELWGEDKRILATSTNATGKIVVAKAIAGKVVLEYTDGYAYYNLRVKATIGGVEIGWKDNLFIPSKFEVDSIKWNDSTVSYTSNLEKVKVSIPSLGTIERFDKISGITHQLPDGTVMLPRGNYTFGLYTVSNGGLKYELNKIVSITGLKTTNTSVKQSNMLFKPLENGKILFCPDTANLNAYLYILDYDPLNKAFTIDKEINLVKTDTDLGYTEYHYLSGDRVLLCTVRDNTPTIANNFKLRVLNTVTGVMTELKNGTHTTSMHSCLIRTGENTFIILGTTLADGKTYDGRTVTLTVNPDNSTVIGTIGTELLSTMVKHTEAGSQKRLRSVQLKNGKTIIYTPEYYVNAPLLIDTVKYNMINTTNGESSVEHTGNIVLSSEDIKSTSQALGFTIKLNNGTVVLLNGNGLFGLRYLAD